MLQKKGTINERCYESIWAHHNEYKKILHKRA